MLTRIIELAYSNTRCVVLSVGVTTIVRYIRSSAMRTNCTLLHRSSSLYTSARYAYRFDASPETVVLFDSASERV